MSSYPLNQQATEDSSDEPSLSVRERVKQINNRLNQIPTNSQVPEQIELPPSPGLLSVKERVKQIEAGFMTPTPETSPEQSISSQNQPASKSTIDNEAANPQKKPLSNASNEDDVDSTKSDENEPQKKNFQQSPIRILTDSDSGFEPEDSDSDGDSFIDKETMESMAKDLSNLLQGKKASTDKSQPTEIDIPKVSVKDKIKQFLKKLIS